MTDVSRITLADFVLARFAEDEALWGQVCAGPRRNGKTHARRHLAECEAKRRIIELHSPIGDQTDETGYTWYEATEADKCQCSSCGFAEKWEQAEHGPTYPCPTLRFLALPYADHPDYRQEWRP